MHVESRNRQTAWRKYLAHLGALTMPRRTPYIIAYDISCPTRQRHARELLRGYASGGQYSMFECWLTATEYRHVKNTLEQTLHPATDRLHIFRLTEQTEPRLLGKAKTLIHAPLLVI